MKPATSFIAAALVAGFLTVPALASFPFADRNCQQELELPYLLKRHIELWSNEVPKLGFAAGDVLTLEQRGFAAAQARLRPYFESADFTDSIYRAYLSVQADDIGLRAAEFQKALAEMPPSPFSEKALRAVLHQTRTDEKPADFFHALRIHMSMRPGLVRRRVMVHSWSTSFLRLMGPGSQAIPKFEDPFPRADASLHAAFFFEDDQIEFIEKLIKNRNRQNR